MISLITHPYLVKVQYLPKIRLASNQNDRRCRSMASDFRTPEINGSKERSRIWNSVAKQKDISFTENARWLQRAAACCVICMERQGRRWFGWDWTWSTSFSAWNVNKRKTFTYWLMQAPLKIGSSVASLRILRRSDHWDRK